MQENKVRMVIDKKTLLSADENLDITKEIIKRLDKNLNQLSLIKLNYIECFLKKK